MTILTLFAPLAAASLAAAIWQSALIVFAVALALRLLPGITAAARSALWSAVFLLTLALPFAHLRPQTVSESPASLHLPPACALAIIALWAALSLLRAARLLVSALRLYRVAAQASPIVPAPEIADLLVAQDVILCTSREVDVPSVAGFFRPRILVPAALLAHIAPADLYAILLHEFAHLRRRDSWTNLLQKLALVLFPLNPVLLWVERRLCLERELACDDSVLQATGGAAKAYATCLANLAEASLLRRGLTLALGAWHRQSELARRVHRILRNPARQMQPLPTAVFGGLTLAATLGTGLLAAKSPQLISFTLNIPVTEAASSPAPIMPGFHPAFVKATLPQSRPVLTALTVPRKHARRITRISAVRSQRRAATTNVILIGWQPAVTRWAVPPSFHLTYAAVPTRTGWLVFQL